MKVDIKKFKQNNIYPSVCIYADNAKIPSSIRIHRTVAIMFLSSPPSKDSLVRHKNQDKYDFRLSNLEWSTRKEIMEKVFDSKNSKKPKRNPFVVPVCQLDGEGIFIKEFESASEAERKLNIPHQNIIKVCQGKRDWAGHYKWKYKEIENEDIKNEEWKSTKKLGYPNYSVSNKGRIKNVMSNRFLMGSNKNGYIYVDLINEKGRKSFGIHQLVPLLFIPNPEKKPDIDHIDTNSLNNNVENLRWVTKSENRRNTKTMEKYYKGVIQISLNDKEITRFVSISEAGRKTGADPSAIIRCCTGRGETAGGYKWKYQN